MEYISKHIISFVVFAPLVFGVLIALAPVGDCKKSKNIVKGASLFGALIVFLGSLTFLKFFDEGVSGFQLLEQHPWIEMFGVSYNVGIDGISLWLVLLTTFLTPIVILASWNSVENKIKAYHALILMLETGMLGAFVSLDLILFYIFWEAMLIPMYFLIGIWGGNQRIYASMKFFLYTLVGSLIMLVAIFYVLSQYHAQFGAYSAALVDLYKVKILFEGMWSSQTLLFLAFALAFAIKVPLFPFHTWLPDAHVQAPTAGSVILAGVLLKLGGYGFIRFAFPMFPQAVHFLAPVFIGLGAIAIVYGAFVAMVQPDIKKLVAYSSVSHMGYVMIGLFSLNPLAVTGAIYQMLSHGISTGGLFLIVGMLYERRHTREISDFGGITKVVPMLAVAFLIITFSSIALPGTNGFIGEFLILLGLFQVHRTWAIVATLGVIFGAAYMLWMFQRVMFGPLKREENKNLRDLSLREWVVMAPILVSIFVMGIFPNLFLSKMDSSIKSLLAQITI